MTRDKARQEKRFHEQQRCSQCGAQHEASANRAGLAEGRVCSNSEGTPANALCKRVVDRFTNWSQAQQKAQEIKQEPSAQWQ